MRAAEESAVARGVAIETLMDQAGAGVACTIRQFFPKPARCIVFAVDLPTGLDADSGENDPEDAVVADFTVTIGFAKHGLIVDSALNFVGRIQIVPLPGLWPEGSAPNELATSPYSLSPLLPRRRF